MRLQVNYDPNDVSITVSAVPSPPTIKSIVPTGGSTAGNQTVVITGTNFKAVQSVTFGGVPAEFWRVDSSTQITATAPPHVAGTVSIVVTTAGGSAKANYTYSNDHVPPPAVSSLETSSGFLPGGNTIIIDGSGFTGASEVDFVGGTASNPIITRAPGFTVVSDTKISVVVPASSTTGAVDVVVKSPAGISTTGSADKYTYNQQTAPTLTGLSVSAGSAVGGTPVTITGTGFANVYDVLFVNNQGGESAASFTINSPNSITVVTPPDLPGTVDISVVTLGGVSATSGADQFTFYPASNPAISSISPHQGFTLGGTLVTITGVHFTGVTSVMFGNVAAHGFTFISDTTIKAVAPAEGAGAVDITVATASASSADTPADKFTFVAPPVPVVTGLSTSSGTTAGGDKITILGSGFTTATGVSFGGVQVSSGSFTILSDTAIVVTTPADSPGTVDVTVTDVSGTSSATGADKFTFVAPPPQVLAVTPNSGSTTGGNTITVLGTGFTGATAVDFNGVPVSSGSFTVNNDNSITVTTPADSAGVYDITVTTAGGTSATSSNDQFTFIKPPAPVVTSLNVHDGSESGGTVVIITGSHFTGTTEVDFGNGKKAASFTINSDTQITAMTPAESPGLVDVTVTTSEGTSSLTQNDQFTFDAVVPTVSSISTSAGPLAGGNSITIDGTGFLSTTAVDFGMTAATSFTIESDTTLVAVAPAESSGTIDITVVSTAGTSSTSSADKYTYDGAPTLDSPSPFSDTATGGTPITLVGTGFSTATEVDFGSQAVTSFTINSDTSITVTAPAHMVGNVALSVVGPGGSSNTEQFSYTVANTVTWTAAGNGSWNTGSNWSGGQVPGTGDDVVIPSGITVTFDSGTDTIHQLTVNGTLDVTGGTLDVNATGTLDNLAVSGGTLGGTGALTVTGDFTAGGGGTIDTTTGLTLEGTTSISGDLGISGTVINEGTTTWTGDGTLTFANGTWDNANGSTFIADSNGTLQTISGTGTFDNNGTIDKTGLSGLTLENGMTLDNSSSLTVDNGSLTLDNGTNSGTITLNNGSDLTTSGDFTLTSSSTISGNGTVDVTSGDLTLGGTLTATSLTVEQGASAGGSATIDTNVINNGTVFDEGAIGVLAINGNFTQSSTGTLSLSVGGTSAGTTYDQLQISGMANLGGTLKVSTVNGFVPVSNTTFTLLTYDGFNGSFGTIQTPGFGPGAVPQTGATSLNLVTMAESPQGPTTTPTEVRPDRYDSENDRMAVVVAAVMPEEQALPDDVLLASADNGSPAPTDDGVWQDVTSIQEMLSLPIRMLEAVVEAVV
jgi:hypothetical protein